MSEKEKKGANLFNIALNPNRMGYRGNVTPIDLPDYRALVEQDVRIFNSSIAVVAHQGNTDFSVYFGKLVPHSAEFVAELAIVLSFDNFSKFLTVLKNISKGLQNGGRKEESMAQVNHKAKPADVVEKG